MRLIDSDALKQQVEFAQEHTWPEDLAFQVPKMIDNAPTIDAIPMWWITEKFLDVLNKDKELSKAVWLVRKAWQKEQEART